MLKASVGILAHGGEGRGGEGRGEEERETETIRVKPQITASLYLLSSCFLESKETNVDCYTEPYVSVTRRQFKGCVGRSTSPKKGWRVGGGEYVSPSFGYILSVMMFITPCCLLSFPPP